MHDLVEYRVNADTVIIGISVDGLWLITARRARLKMAWRLARIAWRVLLRGHKNCLSTSKERK